MHLRRLQLSCLIALWCSAGAFAQSTQSAAPATQPATQPGQGFEVREWALFVEDAFSNQLNPNSAGMSPLPGFVDSRRRAASAAPNEDNEGRLALGDAAGKDDTPVAPVTIGVIRMVGTSDSKVDVRLERSSGSFLANWPQAEMRETQILWRDLTLSDSIAGHAEQPEAGGWFADLRSTKSAALLLADQVPERFLMYDVTIPYASPLKVKTAGSFAFDLSNTSETPLHGLMLLQSDHGHWRRADVGELAVAAKPAPSTAPATGPAPTPAPATQPQSSASVKLQPTPATQPADLADGWRPALRQAGVADTDCDIIAKLITGIVGDSTRMVAIYRMDDAEFDRLLPIEVVPQPAKITRIGLVIIENADPGIDKDIDALIAELGNPDWSKRESASKALTKMGPSARPRLQLALKSKDPEVVWRAERLIAQFPQDNNSN